MMRAKTWICPQCFHALHPLDAPKTAPQCRECAPIICGEELPSEKTRVAVCDAGNAAFALLEREKKDGAA